MHKKDMAKKLIELRRKSNLTQKELGDHIHYSDKVISKWERGDSLPSVDALERLASFYQITIDDLMDKKARERLPVSIFELYFKKTKGAHKWLHYSVLLLLCLSISIFLIDIWIGFLGALLFLIYLIFYLVLIARTTWMTTYQGYHIRVETTASKVSLYINDVFVDQAQSLLGNYLLLSKIGDLNIRIRVSNMFVSVVIHGFVET